MKKMIVAAFLIAGIAGFAQEKQEVKDASGPQREHKGPGKKVTPEEQTKQLAKELSLDEKQQAKVKALYDEEEKQRAAARPEEGKKGEAHDHAAMEAGMKAKNDAFDTKMKGILTADQYTKWKASVKKGGAGKPRGKRPEAAQKS